MDDVMTDDLRAVLDQASAAALALHHQYIGTEHLLLGLAQLRSESLAERGVDPAAAIGRVHEIVGAGQRPVDAPELPYTPRAERVLANARRAATPIMSTRHLVQALADEPAGVASRVLNELQPMN
jgi:ATP-dependent Clp protease ATP-binding subunit ClpC